jgi:hypothetical protein
LAQGDADEAIDGAERAARILQRLFGNEHAVLGATLNLHGRALLASGQSTAAEAVLLRALAIQSALAPHGNPATEATRALLAQSREALGRRSEAKHEPTS